MSLALIQRAAKQVMNFYRRPLPPSCISFSSEEGKILFKEALNHGQMENYFRLASQLRTQDEPAFCGLATLVMVLNALEIDPGRIWKGSWRWYHEEMLDCCIPIDTVKTKGITLDQFICISKCNGLTTNFKRVSDNEKFDDFKKLLLRITKIDNEILVVSYSRKGLGQTGDGHFASVGGYHSSKEMVLLFDTARFKYPPHWVPITTLWNSMKDIDTESGQPRGYIVLTKDVDSSCLLLLATSVVLNEYMMTKKDCGALTNFLQVCDDWLDTPTQQDNALLLVNEFSYLIIDKLLFLIKSGEKLAFPLTCHSNFSEEVSNELEIAMSAIIREVVECQIGIEIYSIISRLHIVDVKLLSEAFVLPKLHGCSLLILQDNRMKMTFLIASWLMVIAPIKKDEHDSIHSPYTRSQMLQKLTRHIVFNKLCIQSQMELIQLSNKIAKMSNCRDKNNCCTDWTCGGATCHD